MSENCKKTSECACHQKTVDISKLSDEELLEHVYEGAELFTEVIGVELGISAAAKKRVTEADLPY